MPLADLSEAVPRYEDVVVLCVETQAALLRQRGELLPKAYEHAARMAAAQTGIAVECCPKVCPYSLAEMLEQP